MTVTEIRDLHVKILARWRETNGTDNVWYDLAGASKRGLVTVTRVMP
jgi:hypothetical protein